MIIPGFGEDVAIGRRELESERPSKQKRWDSEVLRLTRD